MKTGCVPLGQPQPADSDLLFPAILGQFQTINLHLGSPTHPLPVFGEEDLGSLHIKGHGLNATANPVPGVALGPELAALGTAIVQPADGGKQTQDPNLACQPFPGVPSPSAVASTRSPHE